MEQVSIIGIDSAKRSFSLHSARADGSVAFRRTLSRLKVLDFLKRQPKCIVEAYSSSHTGAGRCEARPRSQIVAAASSVRRTTRRMLKRSPKPRLDRRCNSSP